SRSFQRYWTRVFDSAFERRIDAWSYNWLFSYWSQRGLGIVPARNLISNIGFGPDATHTRSADSTLACQPLERLQLPLRHPKNLTRDTLADGWTDRHVFSIRAATEIRVHYRQELRKWATSARYAMGETLQRVARRR